MCLKDHPVFFIGAIYHPIYFSVIRFGPDSSSQQKYTANSIFQLLTCVVHHSALSLAGPDITPSQQELIKECLMTQYTGLFDLLYTYQTPESSFLCDWGNGSNFMLGVVSSLSLCHLPPQFLLSEATSSVWIDLFVVPPLLKFDYQGT